MRSSIALSASLLCGCNLVFGLDSAEDRSSASSSSTSASATTTSASGSASSGEVASSGTASSTTTSGGGDGGSGGVGGSGGDGGNGGEGGHAASSTSTGEGGSGPCVRSIVYTHTATFEDFPWPDWDCSGVCQATRGRETNGDVVAFEPEDGTEYIVRTTDWDLVVGDTVELSAMSRAVFDVDSATLSLRNAEGDLSEVSIPLSVEEAPDMHAALGEVVVTMPLSDVHIFVHATGADRFDVDDVVVTVRRCD